MNRTLPLVVMAALAVAAVAVMPLAGSAEAQSIGTLADIVDTAKTKSTTYGMLPPQNPGTSTVELTFKRVVSGINENTFLVDGVPTTAYRCVNEVYTLTVPKAIRPDATPTVSISRGASFTSGGISGCTPGTPDGLAIQNGTPSYSEAAVTWNEAINSQAYKVQYRQGTSGNWTTFNDGTATATSETVTGLSPGTAYQFRVAGTNVGMTGNYTEPMSHTTTGALAPGAPTNLVADSYNRTNILVTWDRPTNSSGADVTKYFVQYKPNGTAWTSTNATETASTTTSMIVTLVGLDPTIIDPLFNFRVKAMNSAGNSTYHDGGPGLTLNSGYCVDNLSPKAYPKGCLPPGSEKATSRPGVPTGLDIVNVVGGNPTFTWNAGPMGNSPITGYWMAYWSGSSWQRACSFADGQDRVCSPSSGNHFARAAQYFTARATQGNELSPAGYADERSAVLDLGARNQATIQKVPAQVGGLFASSVNATAISLDWKKPLSRGAEITDYNIYTRIGDSGAWTKYDDGTSKSTSATLAKLPYGTQYDIRVAAVNSVGVGFGTNSTNTVTHTTGLNP